RFHRVRVRADAAREVDDVAFRPAVVALPLLLLVLTHLLPSAGRRLPRRPRQVPAPGRVPPNDAECPAPRINTESDLPARRTDDGGILPFLAVVVYSLAHTRGAGQEDRPSGGDRVPDEPERFSVPDDIIGALSDRVSELTQHVATLETELDAARKRIAIYEEFDTTVREGLAGAL